MRRPVGALKQIDVSFRCGPEARAPGIRATPISTTPEKPHDPPGDRQFVSRVGEESEGGIDLGLTDQRTTVIEDCGKKST